MICNSKLKKILILPVVFSFSELKSEKWRTSTTCWPFPRDKSSLVFPRYSFLHQTCNIAKSAGSPWREILGNILNIIILWSTDLERGDSMAVAHQMWWEWLFLLNWGARPPPNVPFPFLYYPSLDWVPPPSSRTSISSTLKRSVGVCGHYGLMVVPHHEGLTTFKFDSATHLLSTRFPWRSGNEWSRVKLSLSPAGYTSPSSMSLEKTQFRLSSYGVGTPRASLRSLLHARWVSTPP